MKLMGRGFHAVALFGIASMNLAHLASHVDLYVSHARGHRCPGVRAPPTPPYTVHVYRKIVTPMIHDTKIDATGNARQSSQATSSMSLLRDSRPWPNGSGLAAALARFLLLWHQPRTCCVSRGRGQKEMRQIMQIFRFGVPIFQSDNTSFC